MNKLSILSTLQEYQNILKKLSYDDAVNFEKIILENNINKIFCFTESYYSLPKILIGKNRFDTLIEYVMREGDIDDLVDNVHFIKCSICKKKLEDRNDIKEHLIENHTLNQVLNGIIAKTPMISPKILNKKEYILGIGYKKKDEDLEFRFTPQNISIFFIINAEDENRVIDRAVYYLLHNDNYLIDNIHSSLFCLSGECSITDLCPRCIEEKNKCFICGKQIDICGVDHENKFIDREIIKKYIKVSYQIELK